MDKLYFLIRTYGVKSITHKNINASYLFSSFNFLKTATHDYLLFNTKIVSEKYANK